MKTIFILFCTLLVCGSAIAKPSDYDAVKRAQLIEWVEQLVTKTKQVDAKLVQTQGVATVAQGEVVRLQGEVDALTAERDTARKEKETANMERDKALSQRDAYRAKAIENGLQRDVFVFLFAAALTAAIFSGVWRYLTGMISITGPWGFLIIGALGVGTFALTVFAIRIILHLITSNA